MKTIFEIFKTDLKQLCKNPLVLLIIMGMIFLAGVYAWLNIDSNWNPYSNTSEMPIAVANEDSGANFLGKEVNIGESLIEKLATNDDVKWIFVEKENAIEGTKSGDYYGAIVIPENFTDQITTLFVDAEIQKPKFDFYVNQKKNPVAPIIVDKVVGTIKTQVDKSFVNNVIYEVVNQAENLPISETTTTSGVIEDLKEAQNRINELQNLMSSASAAADATGDALKSIQKLLAVINTSTNNIMELSDYDGAIKEFGDVCNNLNTALDGYMDKANETIAMLEDFTNKLDPESEIYKKIFDLVTKLKTVTANLQSNYIDKLEKLSGATMKNLSVLTKNISGDFW